MRDVRQEPVLGEGVVDTAIGAAGREFKEVIDRRGYSTLFDTDKEKEFPLTETLFQEGDKKERVAPLLKVFTGIGLTKESSETGKFLERLGFKDYKMRTKTLSPGFQRYETKILRELLPLVVKEVRSPQYVQEIRRLARNRPEEERDRKSDEAFIRDAQRLDVETELASIKRAIDPVIEGADEESSVVDASGNPIDVRLTGYLADIQKYRRLKPTSRRDARNMLPNLLKEAGKGNEKPSMADPVHIRMMLEYARDRKK